MLLDAKGMGLFICSLIAFEFLAGLGTLVSKRGCCLDCQSSTSWLAQFNLSRLMFKMLEEPRLQKIKEKGFEEGPYWISLPLSSSLFHPMFGNETKDCQEAFLGQVSKAPMLSLAWLATLLVCNIYWLALGPTPCQRYLQTS